MSSTTKPVPINSCGTRLQGRDRPFAQALAALSTSTSTSSSQPTRSVVLVTARAGVGRTEFLAAIVRALDGERRCLVVRGRRELAEVPFGALAPLLAELPAADGADGGAAVALHRAVSVPGSILLVDDAELLDPASLGVLEQIAEAGQTPMVVARTIRPAGAPAGAAAFGRVATATIELAALTAEESAAVVKERLGTSVGPLAADEMVRLAAGSTRTLVELVDAAAGACDLHDETGAWREEWNYLSDAVIDSLPGRPLQAEPLVADLLTVIAIAGELPVEQGGTSGVSERGTQRAEAEGFVTTRRHDGRIWVAPAHPLYPALMLTQVTELERAGFCAAGADMLDGYPAHRVRRALLQLRAGQTVPPSQLLEMARRELAERRYSTAITLGRHAVAQGDDSAARRAVGEYVQAQAHSQVGRIDEASLHFTAAWTAIEHGRLAGESPEESFLAALAQAEGNHLAFRMLRPELAVQRVEAVLGHLGDPALRELVEAELVKWRVMAGQGISSEIAAFAALGPVETPGDLNLLILTAALHTMGGNLVLAGEAVERGLAECDRFVESLPNARDLLQLSEVLVLSFTGRFPEAKTAARANLERAEQANPSARGMWRFVLAMIELHTGSPARAWKFIADGRRDLVWRDIAGLLPAADALSAAIAARTGRFAIARSWLDQLTPAEVRDPKVELYAALARAWVSSSSGRPGFAVRSLAPAIGKAVDSGQRYLAALVAYEAVRVDPVVGSTVMLPTLIAARTAFPLFESHARAVVARNDVLPIAKELAELGLLGPAIDAARWSAENAGDDVVRASRAHRLADSWTVRTGVSLSTRRRQAHPRVTPLTDREWQLASGAAAHRTSAELATEFGISVRTVDNHLARIYKKLGISGRRELAAELAALQLESPYTDAPVSAGPVERGAVE